MLIGASLFLCLVLLILSHRSLSPPPLGLCEGYREGPRAGWQLTLGPFSLAEARVSLGSGLADDCLCGKVASPGQSVWAHRDHPPGRRIIPLGALPEGVLSLTRNMSQINGSFLVSCQLLLVLPESLNRALERG